MIRRLVVILATAQPPLLSAFIYGHRGRLHLLCTMVVSIVAEISSGNVAFSEVDFNREIRPILSDNCFYCHGPDGSHRQAGLRLDDRSNAVELRAIVPGCSSESCLIDRINNSDPNLQMPPSDSNKHLTADQKLLLQRWIDEGAVYKKHWSYERPIKSAVGEGRHPIDYLIDENRTAAGFASSSPADRRTLVRRLFFDLLGLPPTPEQIDAFVNDPSPEAYSQLVERLLASPHYGERMAIGWLDVVRFADTIGYHSDNPHEVWPYRDYVIKSFNENKSFDQFTVEQLAGDLLPESNPDQKVASCFNRLLMTTGEGGAQPRDYEARMLADRVRAIGTVWLGQTLGCCQCHDHKFDPMTTKDFYSIGAFFADIDEPIIGLREAGMLLPDADQTAQLNKLRTGVAELRQEYDVMSPQQRSSELAWEKLVLAELAVSDRWQKIVPTEVSSLQGSKLSVEPEGVISAEPSTAQLSDTFTCRYTIPAQHITGIRIDALPHPGAPLEGPGLAADGSFMLSEVEVIDSKGSRLPLAHASATWEANGSPASNSIDGISNDGFGWSTNVPGVVHAICFELHSPITASQETSITVRLHQNHGKQRLVGRFSLSVTATNSPVRAPRVILPPAEIRELLTTEQSQREPAKQSAIDAYYKTQLVELADLRTRLNASERAVLEFESKLPRCLVSKSLAEPRTVRVLPRGNWQDESGPIVEPATLHFLPPPKVDKPRRLTRLDLAHWIVQPDNPLTARVFVNRLWKQFFGTGLSKTVDDLGSQGDLPVHPELLDWLACEFVESGWDVKHLIRVIVTSNTYQQSSIGSPELLERDPENRFYARQSQFRLDAELVRDNALLVSGLLDATIGGPSVKPYQPDDYWENLNFPIRTYEADCGPNQHRRGLYTWWQRTFLHPSLLAFDAPSREECAAERSRSNIPQQALALLNDPTYVEAARALAANIILKGGSDPKSRIVWTWRRVVGRVPRDDEIDIAFRVYEKHRSTFTSNPEAASQLVSIGESPTPSAIDPAELAAWTSVARVVLNLHETITRN